MTALYTFTRFAQDKLLGFCDYAAVSHKVAECARKEARISLPLEAVTKIIEKVAGSLSFLSARGAYYYKADKSDDLSYTYGVISDYRDIDIACIRIFIMFTQTERRGHPVIGEGGDSTVKWAVEIGDPPKMWALHSCKAALREVKQALYLHEHFQHAGAIGIEAVFPSYEKSSLEPHVTKFLQNYYPGTLYDVLGMEFPMALYYMNALLTFLSSFHKEGWAHRDMKLLNILVEPVNDSWPSVAVTDFISSCSLTDKAAETSLATSYDYLDPSLAEALANARGELVSGEYRCCDRQAADMWALGLIFCKLLLDPARAHDINIDASVIAPDREKSEALIARAATMKGYVKGWASEQLKKSGYAFSPSALSLLDGLLDPDPRTRLKADEALSQLQFLIADSFLS